MIENYRNQQLWQLMQKCPYLVTASRAALYRRLARRMIAPNLRRRALAFYDFPDSDAGYVARPIRIDLDLEGRFRYAFAERGRCDDTFAHAQTSVSMASINVQA